MMVSNRNLLFQGSIFRCYVSFREGNPSPTGELLVFHLSRLPCPSSESRGFYRQMPFLHNETRVHHYDLGRKFAHYDVYSAPLKEEPTWPQLHITHFPGVFSINLSSTSTTQASPNPHHCPSLQKFTPFCVWLIICSIITHHPNLNTPTAPPRSSFSARACQRSSWPSAVSRHRSWAEGTSKQPRNPRYFNTNGYSTYPP